MTVGTTEHRWLGWCRNGAGPEATEVLDQRWQCLISYHTDFGCCGGGVEPAVTATVTVGVDWRWRWELISDEGGGGSVVTAVVERRWLRRWIRDEGEWEGGLATKGIAAVALMDVYDRGAEEEWRVLWVGDFMEKTEMTDRWIIYILSTILNIVIFNILLWAKTKNLRVLVFLLRHAPLSSQHR